MRVSARLAWIDLLLVVLVAPIAAFAQTTYSFDLPKQALSESLRQVGTQAHINVIFDPIVVKGRKAPALKGTFELKQVLAKVIEGTGLAAEFTGTDTVVVKPLPRDDRKPPRRRRRRTSMGHGQVLETLDTIQVQGVAESLTATRSETPLKEIPQSVSVISQDTIDQQNATDLASALQQAPGITLVQSNSQQTYFYSRGFMVDQFHIDGGAPTSIVSNLVDATSRDFAEFDSVEVLRGSDGLFGGMGSPGASVSLHRKEPTATPQAEFDASAGSWNQYRLVGDVSGPLNASGTLSGRMVVSATDQNYYYQIANRRERMIYGILKYDVSASTTLEVGGSYERTRAITNYQGLPWYDNGTDPHLPRSLGLTASWAHSKVQFSEGFAKLDHHFNDNWRLRVDATYLEQRTPEYTIYSWIGPISSATGLLPTPLEATGGVYNDKQSMLDTTLTGSFQWLGQKQNVMIGADYQHDTSSLLQLIPDYPTVPPIDPFAFEPQLYPVPDLSARNLNALADVSSKDMQSGIYGSFRFSPVKGLALIAGGRLSNDRTTQIYNLSVLGTAQPPDIASFKDSNKLTPYAGITYDLGKHYTMYASYADIYTTNGQVMTKEDNPLQPANGVTMEGGIKGSWFGNTLNASFALFKVDQSGVAAPDTSVPETSNCCFVTESIKSKGFEAELSGMLTPNWQLTAGYTYDIHKDVTSYFVSELPRNLFKLWTNYQLPFANHRLSVGGGIRAQSPNRTSECGAYASDGSCAKFVLFHQSSYLVADLRVAYVFNDHWSASLNINNVFDRTYYQTLGELEYGNWYGAPRNFMFKFEGKF